MSELKGHLRNLFTEHFGAPRSDAVLIRAPGRVNLIGEHTDYNGGFVLPMAIDRAVWVLAQPRADDAVRVFAAEFNQEATFNLHAIERSDQHLWLNYVMGVAQELLALGVSLTGMDAVICGDVPLGAGLSSSAAIEVATAFTFLHLNPQSSTLNPADVALLCQRAENRFVGVNCGIMDQFIATMGKAGTALLIDCRDLSYRHVPLNLRGHCFAIVDSKVPRTLASSKYNERRAECEEAVRLLSEYTGERFQSLRDVTARQLHLHEKQLPNNVRRRAMHVLGEIVRTEMAARVLERGDLRLFGKLMNESHESLKNFYEVSCPELDTLVDIARSLPGVLGSRLTGAGFGGCTVTLLRRDCLDTFLRELPAAYERAHGRTPAIYVSEAADGAGRVAP
ncbi:MAG: galactokinase [Abditibacteriales bacterium]|nr:galactokinase [Abditibacteriales bacterium]MDW8367103.1 galactokinase [Abditibacteriales bacterium]